MFEVKRFRVINKLCVGGLLQSFFNDLFAFLVEVGQVGVEIMELGFHQVVGWGGGCFQVRVLEMIEARVFLLAQSQFYLIVYPFHSPIYIILNFIIKINMPIIFDNVAMTDVLTPHIICPMQSIQMSLCCFFNKLNKTKNMGGSQSLLYSVELPNQNQPENSTKIRRRPEFLNGLIDSPDAELKTLQQIVLKTFAKFPNNDCIGQIRTRPGEQPGKEQKYVVYKQYREVQQITDALNRAIHDLNLSPQIEEVPGLKLRFIGIFSRNRAEWLEVDAMGILNGYCVVPIYDTLGAENIPYVLNHTNMPTLFCSRSSLDVLLKCDNLGSVKNIVSFDPVQQDIVQKYRQKGVTVYIYQDLIQKYLKIDVKVEKRIHTPDDIVSFCYTSGTTGPPKGAMLTQRNFAAYTAVLLHNPDFQMSEHDTHLSYLPLAHVLEAVCALAMFAFGGRICAFSGDIKNIKDDLAAVKPTYFMSVPRLYNRFYDAVKDKFSKTEGFKKTLLDKALETKLANVKHDGSYSHMIYDKIVFNKTKELFGGNCRWMGSGSAPLSPQVHSFMKAIGCAPLMEGYGQTQSTGVSFLSAALDPEVGHVGGPSSMAEYKLLDIPEMNYTHHDKDEQGRSMPRGEVLIRGPGVFKGYYKDVEKTKETINEEGWLHTGDVGAITPVTKALKLIDRKKNIFKLQQGEYVASERVEAVYLKKEDMIQEMFLYGDSFQSFCVAIIVPVRAAIENIAKAKNIQGTFEQLCKNKEVRTEFITQLNAYSKKNGLAGFEQPKNVYLETVSFQEKNILTTTMKLQRFAAKTLYKPEIDAMYAEGLLGARPE